MYSVSSIPSPPRQQHTLLPCPSRPDPTPSSVCALENNERWCDSVCIWYYVCGVCMWCVYVVCVCGACMWCVYVVCVCGVCMWCVYVVCVCGVCMWYVYVVCVCGMCMWCVYVVCVCGVCVWCVYVVCVHTHLLCKHSPVLLLLSSYVQLRRGTPELGRIVGRLLSIAMIGDR